jgi:hypothetical protein
VIEKAKTLAAKEKTGEFKSQHERDQLSVALENEEHHGRIREISSIASWKEGFVNESHLYKKRRTHEHAHNDEEAFAQQFFNFMREKTHNILYRCIFQKLIWISATLSNPSLRAVPAPLLIRRSIMWMTSRIPHLAHYCILKAGHQ